MIRMIYPITSPSLRSILIVQLDHVEIHKLAQSIEGLRPYPIYVNGNRLVHTRADCYDVLHTITMHEIRMLLVCSHAFINPNGKTHANVPYWVVRKVYEYLKMNVQPIQCHPDYPAHPAWQPNLTQRQIDAILANHHNAQRKEGAK